LDKIAPSTLFIGQNIISLPTCQSTNDELAELAAIGLPEGAVVMADEQTAGRGQRGNQWEAQPGQNLTCSVLLRPTFLPADRQFDLGMAVALAAYYALKPWAGEALCLKWPNDIFVGEKKIGGILIENTLKGKNIAHAIVGIGINIHQTSFSSPHATSLACINDIVPQRETVLARWLEALEQQYLLLRQGAAPAIKANYQQRLLGMNQWRSFQDLRGSVPAQINGSITGIDEHGRLLLKNASGGLDVFAFKEIAFIMG
jgi:BirA family transcriptional regulator, biotin operon repressor / biotin---[acetyl-CoA-carboxylase] ligase